MALLSYGVLLFNVYSSKPMCVWITGIIISKEWSEIIWTKFGLMFSKKNNTSFKIIQTSSTNYMKYQSIREMLQKNTLWGWHNAIYWILILDTTNGIMKLNKDVFQWLELPCSMKIRCQYFCLNHSYKHQWHMSWHPRLFQVATLSPGYLQSRRNQNPY